MLSTAPVENLPSGVRAKSAAPPAGCTHFVVTTGNKRRVCSNPHGGVARGEAAGLKKRPRWRLVAWGGLGGWCFDRNRKTYCRPRQYWILSFYNLEIPTKIPLDGTALLMRNAICLPRFRRTRSGPPSPPGPVFRCGTAAHTCAGKTRQRPLQATGRLAPLRANYSCLGWLSDLRVACSSGYLGRSAALCG